MITCNKEMYNNIPEDQKNKMVKHVQEEIDKIIVGNILDLATNIKRNESIYTITITPEAIIESEEQAYKDNLDKYPYIAELHLRTAIEYRIKKLCKDYC